MADYSLINPLDQQAALAEILRGRKRSADQEMLQAAFQKGHRFDQLAAVSNLMNNPAAVAAATTAQKTAAAAKPVAMGQTGFMMPDTGDFVESPMYADEKRAGREQQRDLLRERRKSQGDERARDRAPRETLANLAEGGKNDRAEEGRALKLLIAGMVNRLGYDKLDKQGAGKVRPLPAGEVRKLADQESSVGTLSGLVDNFKDEYAGQGTKVGGQIQNFMGRYQPLGLGKGYEQQANWWQNYNDHANLLRNKLFGTALTAPEKAAFDAANISEGMAPDIIRTRLQQQHQATVRAYNKLRSSFEKAGYNMDEFSDMMEAAPAQKPGAVAGTPSKPVPAAAPKRIRYDANGNEVTGGS